MINIYISGSYRPEINTGTYAAIVVFPDNHENIISGKYQNSTQHRLNLIAVIKALSSLPASNINIYSDSDYITKGINKWLHTWKSKSWKKYTDDHKSIQNVDLWKQIDTQIQRHQSVSVIRIKKKDSSYNRKADKIAKEEYDRTDIPGDVQ